MDAFQKAWLFARCGAVAAALLLLFAKPAAASPAEDFIQTYVTQGLAILNDKTLSHAEKHTRFQALLEPMTDMRRIALYALGPAAKTVPSEKLEAFVVAFHEFQMSLYERELWRVGQLKIENTVERSRGDVIVQGFRVDASGYRSVNADEIDFRVLNPSDKPILVDLCVLGVWVAVSQKAQYSEFLEQRGATIDKLTAKIRNRASKMNRYLAAGEEEPPRVRKARTR
ncbi:MAG: MlaC/ttg2D family ABC transporter substrate-binding protein [Rhizomicrobium sp.]